MYTYDAQSIRLPIHLYIAKSFLGSGGRRAKPTESVSVCKLSTTFVRHIRSFSTRSDNVLQTARHVTSPSSSESGFWLTNVLLALCNVHYIWTCDDFCQKQYFCQVVGVFRNFSSVGIHSVLSFMRNVLNNPTRTGILKLIGQKLYIEDWEHKISFAKNHFS